MTAAPPVRSLALTRTGLPGGRRQYYRGPPKSLPRANSAYVGEGVRNEEGKGHRFHGNKIPQQGATPAKTREGIEQTTASHVYSSLICWCSNDWRQQVYI